MRRREPESDARPCLTNLSVVELGRGIAVAYAAKMLADFGAAVSRVKEPEGLDPHRDARPACRAFLDSGKRSIALDLSSASGNEEFLGLVLDADILIEDRTAAQRGERGLDAATMMAINPKLVVVSVTPFGQTGPYCNFRGGDLEVAFLSGLAYLTPRDIAKPETGELPPPLKMPGSLVSFYAGASAAAAALTGLHARDRVGNGIHVDVSMLESLIPALRREISLYHFEGKVASRFMRVWRLAPYGVKPCKDGFVFLQVVEKYHWEGLVDMMGSPEWAMDTRYLEPEFRFQHRTDIETRIAPWLLTQSKHEFALEAQRRGVPFAPINELADLVRIPQLHHRRFFRAVTADDGRPYVVPGVPFAISGGVCPQSGTRERPRAESKRMESPGCPLSGLRVIDFGHVWAGPYCAAILADMGAEVIKVESQHRVDIHRRQGPYPERRPGLNRSGVWNTQNRGKRSVALNLSTERGRELARQLVATADVVVENFAPDVMSRLELDYPALCRLKPDLVMASLSAFGQEGPQKGYVGYGPSLDAWAGLDRMTAYQQGGPNALGGMFPDTGSAIHAAVAILAALHDRDRTGKGCYIDVSELEVSILLLADLVAESLGGEHPPQYGNSDPYHFPHGCYRCAGDDAWIALSVPDSQAWEGLCKTLRRSDWAADETLKTGEGRRARSSEIDETLTRWARERDARAAMVELQSNGVPAAIANSAKDLLSDPHLVARRYFQTVEHSEAGPQPMYGPIWRFGDQAEDIGRAAPLLGEDNVYVLGTLLGISSGEVADLVAAKVVY